MIPYLPPILRNYFYFNAPERGNFALLLFDPGFLNPVTHVKWNQNHTDEIDWDTGTYGVRAEIRYNTNNTKDPTSWLVVLRRTIDTRVQGGGTAVMPGDQDTYTWLTTGTNWQAHALPAFLAAGHADPLSPSEQTALDALIIALTPSVTASLQNVQANACQYLGAAVTGSGPDATTVAASAQALSAWQELIIQLIRLALPGRIIRDDLLRCLMYRPQCTSRPVRCRGDPCRPGRRAEDRRQHPHRPGHRGQRPDHRPARRRDQRTARAGKRRGVRLAPGRVRRGAASATGRGRTPRWPRHHAACPLAGSGTGGHGPDERDHGRRDRTCPRGRRHRRGHGRAGRRDREPAVASAGSA